MAKIIAFCLIPLVKVNLWLRFMGYLPDEWFWADQYVARHRRAAMNRYGKVSRFLKKKFGKAIVWSWLMANCDKCKDTGRQWSPKTLNSDGSTDVSVKSCSCAAGAEREKRLTNG